MKIIKKGKPPVSPVVEPDTWWVGRTATCGVCGTEVAFDADDSVMHKTVFRGEAGAESVAVYAHCPICDQQGISLRRDRV